MNQIQNERFKQIFSILIYTFVPNKINMYRTNTCGELRIENVGQNVTLSGWVQTIRKVSANLIFIDIRDRYGITQLSFNFDNSENELLQRASKLGREFVIQATGEVIERASKNNNIPTGEIEIKVSELGSQAGILGVAALLLEHVLDKN